MKFTGGIANLDAAGGAVSGAFTAAVPCAAPALVGFVQGSVSAATYAATEKIAYGRNPSFKETLKVGITSGLMAGGSSWDDNFALYKFFTAVTQVATCPAFGGSGRSLKRLFDMANINDVVKYNYDWSDCIEYNSSENIFTDN